MTHGNVNFPTGKSGKMMGVYMGTVVNNVDPTGKGRAMVRISAIVGGQSAWAQVCRPFGATGGAVPTGGNVVVAFEGGDLERPIVLGAIP